MIALFEYQLQISELDELEQIQYVNHQAESGLASLLDKMPVGVIKINEEFCLKDDLTNDDNL